MSVQGARDKGKSGKFYDFEVNARRIGTLDVTKTAADADFNDLKIRRERAYQWHARWAMPNYDQMRTNVVKAGPGLDSEFKRDDSCRANSKQCEGQFFAKETEAMFSLTIVLFSIALFSYLGRC